MNLSDLMNPHMVEATRLTREGRLSDATEAIRRAIADAMPSGIDPGMSDALFERLPGVARPAARPTPARPGDAGHPPAPVTEPRLPEGRFLPHTFRGPAGIRDYKLYVPAGHSDRPLPLLVMLHGCSQDPDDFSAGTQMNLLAEQHGFLVAYPGQSQRANTSRCWNWFEPGDQHRGDGEPAVIAGITREILDRYGADPQRVYAAGMSAGGAMAVILAREYPDLFAAIGVHSGLPYAAAHDLPSALAAMKRGADPVLSDAATDAPEPVPTIVFHGDRDYTVNPRNGAEVVDQVRELYAARQGMAPGAVSRKDDRTAGGRPFTRTVYATLDGRPVLEQWVLHGGGHAWSGGSPDGSHTDPSGPDASAEMVRFFLAHAKVGGH